MKQPAMRHRKGPPKKEMPPHQHYGKIPKGKVDEAGDKSRERKRAMVHSPKGGKGRK